MRRPAYVTDRTDRPIPEIPLPMGARRPKPQVSPTSPPPLPEGSMAAAHVTGLVVNGWPGAGLAVVPRSAWAADPPARPAPGRIDLNGVSSGARTWFLGLQS